MALGDPCEKVIWPPVGCDPQVENHFSRTSWESQGSLPKGWSQWMKVPEGYQRPDWVRIETQWFINCWKDWPFQSKRSYRISKGTMTTISENRWLISRGGQAPDHSSSALGCHGHSPKTQYKVDCPYEARSDSRAIEIQWGWTSAAASICDLSLSLCPPPPYTLTFSEIWFICHPWPI